MNFFYLFLLAGVVITLTIIAYDRLHKKKVSAILRANKNVPPLFMLRSAELKVNAIKAALSSKQTFSPGQQDVQEQIAGQLEHLTASYHTRQIALSTYYAKLGALLISVNKIKGLMNESQELV